MSDILFVDLVELEQEFYDCLFYYYAYPIDEIQQNLKFSSGERIDILELTIKEKEQIKAGIFSNNFVLSDTYQLHQELLGNNSNSVTVTPDQLYILLEKLELLKFEFPQLTKQIQKKRYSEILQAYVDIDKNICSGLNLKIEKKIKGILSVRVRYEKKLYPKREILYRVLREQTKVKGRWTNLNQAVTSIMPILEERYRDFDLECIRIELTQRRELLCSLEKASLEAKSKRAEEQEIVRQQRKFLNQIRKAKIEIKRLEKLLLLKNPSYELKHKSPFNTEYKEESIIHHLRECRDILKEILI